MSFPGGAALIGPDNGWILIDGDPSTSVGRALAWAQSHGLAEVHVVSAGGAGAAARRAGFFSVPPRVWEIDGRELRPARAAPPPVLPSPSAAALDLVGMLAEAGVEIVVESGEVRGEVLGLEVARIVVDDDGGASVQVGLGRHDREAFALLHADQPTAEALARVVEHVRQHRRLDGPPHPLRSLAAERWLRARLVAEPSLAGLRSLDIAEPTVARSNVKDPAPAIAVGADAEGRPVVVACSVGIDLDLVPAAADARALHAPDARLLLVVPDRDANLVTRRLADALSAPAEVVTVDWS